MIAKMTKNKLLIVDYETSPRGWGEAEKPALLRFIEDPKMAAVLTQAAKSDNDVVINCLEQLTTAVFLAHGDEVGDAVRTLRERLRAYEESEVKKAGIIKALGEFRKMVETRAAKDGGWG